MFLGRNYGSKGIYKGFCFSCNDYFYVSVAGVNAEHDYMYQATDELTGLKTVTVNGDDVQCGYLYEYDNDFETCDIIKRIESSDERKHTFVKGKNYYEYMRKLFPASIISRYPQICPYCGSNNLAFSKVSSTDEYFYKETAYGKECEQSIQVIAEQKILKITSDAERNTLCLRDRPHSMDVSLVVNHLATVEKSILLCTLRYRYLFKEHPLLQRKILHEYTAKQRPLRNSVPDMPDKQTISFPVIINLFKRKERQEKNYHYRRKVNTAASAKAKYIQAETNFRENAATIFHTAAAQIEKGNTEEFLREVPILTEKYVQISEDLCECEKHLAELVVLRKHLRSANMVYPKYTGSLHALTLLVKYINSGRCDSLEGKLGAYNLLESEHLFDLLHGNEEILQAISCREYDQISLDLREDIQKLGATTEKLKNAAYCLLNAGDKAAIRCAQIDYEKQRLSFYSEVKRMQKCITTEISMN